MKCQSQFHFFCGGNLREIQTLSSEKNMVCNLVCLPGAI